VEARGDSLASSRRNRDAVERHDCGILVPTGDGAGFARDPLRRAQTGRNARSMSIAAFAEIPP
jgi:hypothetical protein